MDVIVGEGNIEGKIYRIVNRKVIDNQVILPCLPAKFKRALKGKN